MLATAEGLARANSAAHGDGDSHAPALLIVGQTHHRVWSLNLADRLRRQFAREGLTREIAAADLNTWHGPVIAVRADAVIDPPLVPLLIRHPNLLLTEQDGSRRLAIAAHTSAAGMAKVDNLLRATQPQVIELTGYDVRAPGELGAGFWKALRKKETPYALAVTDANKAGIEWRMFMGTYKGATDIVTKHLWPRPAFYATRWLAGRGITPNMVTAVGAVATIAAYFLFLFGHFGWGLVAAWLMTFLDTVDGKLARTTLTSSKWGDVFDHGIDLLHPPFWYFAWAMGLASVGYVWSPSLFWWVVGVILAGYVLQRLMEGIAIKWLGLEIHIWRKIDTYFRQVTARRNPNLILLTLFTLAGRPDIGLISVAFWTLICLALHGLQLVQALAAKRTAGGRPLESWMSKP